MQTSYGYDPLTAVDSVQTCCAFRQFSSDSFAASICGSRPAFDRCLPVAPASCSVPNDLKASTEEVIHEATVADSRGPAPAGLRAFRAAGFRLLWVAGLRVERVAGVTDRPYGAIPGSP